MVHAKHILICRNDALGDTILALPCCGIIKKHYPNVEISFLGRTYTKAAIAICKHVDHFINYDEIAHLGDKELQSFFQEKKIDTALLLRMEKQLSILMKRSKIKYRIGNFHFMRHLTSCNRFTSFNHKSGLNEAQLDLKLLSPIGIKEIPSSEELAKYYGIGNVEPLEASLKELIDPTKFNLVLHPMTTGNGPAWPQAHFKKLISSIDKEKVKIFLSGGPDDKKEIDEWELDSEDATVIAGKTDLTQLISFVNSCNGLIAGSTGPLHLAAALGIHALGLYPSIPEGKSARRWGPIGFKAETIHSDGVTLDSISPETVLSYIQKWLQKG